jgi:hypothetical protein
VLLSRLEELCRRDEPRYNSSRSSAGRRGAWKQADVLREPDVWCMHPHLLLLQPTPCQELVVEGRLMQLPCCQSHRAYVVQPCCEPAAQFRLRTCADLCLQHPAHGDCHTQSQTPLTTTLLLQCLVPFYAGLVV